VSANQASGADVPGAAAEAAPPPPRWAAALAEAPHRVVPSVDGIACIEVDRANLRAALVALKERGGFGMCTFVTAIDHYPREPRFALNYQLLSILHGDRIRVRCMLSSGDAHAPTACDLWPGANWSERECFDMFGIVFDGHPDLRRLLLPQGYDHHPLRKEFPQAGIEPDRLYRQWDRERRVGWSEPQ